MPKAKINGVDLYYEDTGEGIPVVFVHEFAGDYRSWEPQVRYFSRRYRCITYNARGYPPSEVPESPTDYSQEIAVADLLGCWIISRSNRRTWWAFPWAASAR